MIPSADFVVVFKCGQIQHFAESTTTIPAVDLAYRHKVFVVGNVNANVSFTFAIDIQTVFDCYQFVAFIKIVSLYID
jgi:hypothetical protein